jgi:hypothetical protein
MPVAEYRAADGEQAEDGGAAGEGAMAGQSEFYRQRKAVSSEAWSGAAAAQWCEGKQMRANWVVMGNYDNGVEADVPIENSPESVAAGVDSQVQAA